MTLTAYVKHSTHPVRCIHPQLIAHTSKTLRKICIPPSSMNASQVNGASSTASIALCAQTQLQNTLSGLKLDVFTYNQNNIFTPRCIYSFPLQVNLINTYAGDLTSHKKWQTNKVKCSKLSKALLLNLSSIIFDTPLKNNLHPLAYMGGRCHQMSQLTAQVSNTKMVFNSKLATATPPPEKSSVTLTFKHMTFKMLSVSCEPDNE